MDPIPTNIEGLAIYLAVGVLGLLTWVIKRVLADQSSLTGTIHNHLKEDQKALGEISTHMAASNEVQRSIHDQLLNAALRKPEE